MALGEVGAPALCSPPILLQCPTGTPGHGSLHADPALILSWTGTGCCQHPEGILLSLVLWGDCEQCCTIPPVSAPRSLPTVTNFHIPACFEADSFFVLKVSLKFPSYGLTQLIVLSLISIGEMTSQTVWCAHLCALPTLMFLP